LEAEKTVKKGEKMMNEDLKLSNERKELIIEHLAKLNDQLIEKIIRLKIQLKKLIND